MRVAGLITAALFAGCASPGASSPRTPPMGDPVEVEPTPPAPDGAVEPPPVAMASPEAIDFEALRQASPSPRQTSTPPVSEVTPTFSLTKKWATRVGKTTFRTTMAHARGYLVIGTHGDSLDGRDEASDGAYLLEPATGRVVRVVGSPGVGDRDVGGVAIDGDTIYFTTDDGHLVAAGFDGAQRWAVKRNGKVRPAPAVGDLDGDGQGDVVVGDETGTLAAFDGATGKKLWEIGTGTNFYGARGFIGAPAIGDLDGDGRDDVVAGARDGVLAAYRGRDGKILWQVKHESGIHASPSLVDFDGDGHLEVLAAWSYNVVSVIDARSGEELWGQELSLDSGGIEGLFGSPIPVPGSPGVIVQGTAWWDDRDGIVGVGPFERAWKSFEGRVTASAVVGDLDGDGAYEAIVGTEAGKLVWLRPDGSYAVIATLSGGIEASALLTDVDGDGTIELLVASNDGMLTCFSTGATSRPFLSRFRGDDPRNRGQIGAVPLGWKATRAIPKTGPQTADGGVVRIDYLGCCQALSDQATRTPSPANRRLLEAAAACTAMAARGAPREDMQRAIAGLAATPEACR